MLQLCPTASKTFHFVYLLVTLGPQDVKLPAHSKLQHAPPLQRSHFPPRAAQHKNYFSALEGGRSASTAINIEEITKVALFNKPFSTVTLAG